MKASQELYVCADCFEDEALRAVIDWSESDTCDFCGARSSEPIAAPLHEVAAYIKECLQAEYDDPANWLPYESAEGGYQGSTYDTHDLLAYEIALELPRDHDGRLVDSLVEAINQDGPQFWCEKHPFSLREHEQLQLSWERFSQFIKHERRYFFRRADQGALEEQFEETLAADDLLPRIASRVEDLGLTTRLEVGTKIYRARFRPPGTRFTTALELGPPPPHRAKQNRMSPAGIVMFYGSEDVETAVAEVFDTPGDYAVGEFSLLGEAWVLDLHDIAPPPSFFSETHAWEREPLMFLRRFARDIARPIEHDDRVHIEYVPTQVLTEYFRTQFKHGDRPLGGICYTSARNPGSRSYVLFATQEDLRSGGQPTTVTGQSGRQAAWLELTGVTVVRRAERVRGLP